MFTRGLTRKLSCLLCALVIALASGAALAQQATPDIWQLAPPDSLLIAAFDARPSNASVQVISNARDPQVKEMVAKQQVAMRKAVENLATLFGVSLDFAKDIDSWADEQCALVVVPDGKDGVQPVIVMASKDAAAADATMQKLIAPWQRLGKLTAEDDQDYPITSFTMKDSKFTAYASAFGPVVAVSPSKAALKTALKGGGFAAGSAGDKVFKAVSGSLFYVFADPNLLKVMGTDPSVVPISSVGMGISAVPTGVKLRLIGFPNEGAAPMIKQLLAGQQTGALSVNAGVPASSLVAASFPNLSGAVAMAGIAGMGKSPIFAAAQAISEMRISAALTAALPMPAGAISAEAESEQTAKDKLALVAGGLAEAKLPTKPVMAGGVDALEVTVPKWPAMYVAQIGKHIVVASDVLALSGVAAAIKGEQPSITQSQTYKETMEGLGDSNLLTLYGSLAPVQGIGYLVEGLGLAHLDPVYGALAKGLQDIQAFGIGAGYDGEMASVTMFLRAKPGIGPGAGAAAIAGTAVGTAVLFPMFSRARESAREASCASHLRQLSIAAIMYAQDNNGKLPSMLNWRAELKPYLRTPISELTCPGGGSVYAFNKNLGGIARAKITRPAETVMFFEADASLPNATGSRANAIFPHSGEGWFAFADGHVVKLWEAPEQSQWVPYTAPKVIKKAPVKKAPASIKKKH